MFGVYVLAELCEIATFVALYHLARAVIGAQQAVLAVLLTMTLLVFSSSALDFGPLVLARPLWALLLLHSWQLIGQRRGNGWFAWSIEAGLLLLTTPAAIYLLLLLVIFALTTAGGRRTLRALDPLYALVVVAVLVLPYAIWVMRAETLTVPALPQHSELNGRALNAAWLLGGLVLGAVTIPVLAFLNSRWFAGKGDEAPIIYRPRVEPLARNFVYFFALAPALGGVVISGLFGLDGVVGGAGAVLLMSGLAMVVAAGDLIAMRRARLLRMVWAAAVAAPAAGVVLASLLLPWTEHRRDRDLDAGPRNLGLLRRELFPPHQPSPARGRRRDPACESDHAAFRPAASVHRCRACAHALDDAGKVQRERRRRGLARLRHCRYPAARHPQALSRHRAGSAARLRMAGDRTPAIAAHRLGHRAAEGDVSRARSPSSLRAQRSNPEFFRGDSLDCFAALAMTGMGRSAPHAPAITFAIARRSCQARRL
ncbi:hypothetical protein ACVWXO_010849 [Bradyrhizobium sp. LM2.7]